MNFLNLFLKNTPLTRPDWKVLSHENQLEEILQLSFEKSGHLAVAVFKHSTRCYISRSALRGVEQDWSFQASEVPFFLLDLLQYPNLSKSLASQYNVIHQSPQLLLIRNGKCVYGKTHSEINSEEAGVFLKSLKTV